MSHSLGILQELRKAPLRSHLPDGNLLTKSPTSVKVPRPFPPAEQGEAPMFLYLTGAWRRPLAMTGWKVQASGTGFLSIQRQAF